MQNLSLAANIGLGHYLVLAAVIFCIGMIGVLLRKNIIVMMMSIELMLNAVNLTFVSLGHFIGSQIGQVSVFFIMTIAAAEAAVGLALVVLIFKKYNEVNIKLFERLKG